MAYTIVLDLLLAGLLIATIGYAMALNRKISGLRRDRASLEKLLASFNTTTDKAAASLSDLQGTAKTLQGKIDNAMTLRDDLAFLVDRGTTVADRLEDGVRDARRDGIDVSPVVAPLHPAQKVAPKPAQKAARQTSREEAKAESRSLLDRIAGGARSAPAPATAKSQAEGMVRSFPTLKAVEDELEGAPAGQGPREMEPRSEAERELLKALRAARQA